jgi:hypothetical protein
LPSPATITPTPENKPDPREAALSLFFQHHNCPPINYQLISDYLESADAYGTDYRLLPAISVQESSCLKHYLVASFNGWGWNSARTGFASLQSGIDFISRQLADGHYYAHKSIEAKLRAYNPNPEYGPKIMGLMKEIENEQVSTSPR